MGQTDLKPTAQGQVESSINDTINFIMAKVAAGEIDAATATELIAAARKDYESNVPVTTSAQQAVQPQQTANPYQADPQTAYAVPEMEPEQTPIDYGQFATSTNYPHTYDVEDSSDVDMDALSGIASDVFDKQPRKKLSRKERKAQAKEMKKLQKESNAKLKANAKSNKSIQKQLKDRDKELSKKNEFARYRRKTAKDVTSFIGYNRMYEDGICEVEEGMFSSCICFEDTSYHSVREDAQKAVFTSICRLYDQFGADTLVQFNIINTPLLKEQIGHRKFFNPSSQLNVNAANDAAVFNEILNEKMRQGVSNIRRKMYITFSVSAPTVDDAVPKLARIENQISQILTSIGSKSHVLDGAERLALLNSQLNPLKPFNFDYRRDISARMVQTTKDCIAPMTLDFKPEGLADCFKTGDMWGQVLVIKKLGSELTDQALSDITELPIPLNVTWFAQPMDKAAAVAFTRQRLAWIDKEIIEEQRSAVQKGYDFSILPQELKYSKEETEDVIDNLQNKNQRLYVFTGLFYTYAPTKKQLDNQVLSIISAARQNSIEVSTYEYRQRQGFNSILPLGHNHCEISRMSTTAEVSILMPFATMELDDKGGNYYGQNKHSSNLIFCNRKLLASPMGFVCGKTGSGKGMAVKTEMTGTILSNPTDEIYIIDRAGEYTGISSRYGGVTYNFAVDSDTYLNPFDTVSVESLSPDAQLVFLIIYATIFIWLLKNSLKICAGAYDLFNEMIGKINQSTVDELKTVTIADSCKESFGAVIGIWVQSMIFDLITIIIKGSVSVMCYMRAMQLYVMAAFSPLPFALLGFDETKNYGVSFCKNFLATCLAGVIILFAMGLFPNLLSGFSGGEISGFKGDMWSSVCASVALMLIVIKSGTIARDVFGG